MLLKDFTSALCGLLISFTVLGLIGVAAYSNRDAPATHKIRLI
jgi:hypothetical protein